jgi:L-asparaginase/Glu-tRNA(Gln) amidotransferase subunit D
MNQRILLIRTGGTIDSAPYDDPRNPPPIVTTLKGADSLVMPTVATLPNHEYVDGFSWGRWDEDIFVKDSQKFTPQDIMALAEMIRKDEDHDFFILTHGTDAMAQNAAALQRELAGTGKVVLFTGAMVPLSMHDKHGSDAPESLRFTLEHIFDQPPGVQIVGRDAQTKRLGFFDPSTVEKDREESRSSLNFTLKGRGL